MTENTASDPSFITEEVLEKTIKLITRLGILICQSYLLMFGLVCFNQSSDESISLELLAVLFNIWVWVQPLQVGWGWGVGGIVRNCGANIQNFLNHFNCKKYYNCCHFSSFEWFKAFLTLLWHFPFYWCPAFWSTNIRTKGILPARHLFNKPTTMSFSRKSFCRNDRLFNLRPNASF